MNNNNLTIKWQKNMNISTEKSKTTQLLKYNPRGDTLGTNRGDTLGTNRGDHDINLFTEQHPSHAKLGSTKNFNNISSISRDEDVVNKMDEIYNKKDERKLIDIPGYVPPTEYNYSNKKVGVYKKYGDKKKRKLDITSGNVDPKYLNFNQTINVEEFKNK